MGSSWMTLSEEFITLKVWSSQRSIATGLSIESLWPLGGIFRFIFKKRENERMNLQILLADLDSESGS
jgi:hypothetical protein